MCRNVPSRRLGHQDSGRHPDLLLRLPAPADHPLELSLLARDEFVAPAREGIEAGPQFQSCRRAMQPEGLREPVDQEPAIGIRQRIGLVAVDHDGRRILATLVGVAALDAPAADQRRLMCGERLLQHPVEHRRGDLLLRVKHHDHHLRRFDGLQGPDHTNLLDTVIYSATPSNAGSVTQGDCPAVALEAHLDQLVEIISVDAVRVLLTCHTSISLVGLIV